MLYGFAGIISFIVSFFWFVTYAGPFRVVTELQTDLFGCDYAKASLCICWLILFAPLSALVRLIEKRLGVLRDPAWWTRVANVADFLWNEGPGNVVGLGLIPVVLGSLFLWGAMTRGPLTTFTLEQAARGERPASNYVHIPDVRIVMASELATQSGDDKTTYYPVESPYAHQDHYRMFVRLGKEERLSPPTELTGVIAANGLPGPLRVHVEKEGFLAPDHLLLLQGDDPVKDKPFGVILIAVGAFIIAVGLGWKQIRVAAKRTAKVPAGVS